ncbi:MAG: hypothetical protein PHY59_06150 [Methanobacterium sp.]|nr:hypothetical protein [Methanobacterium sp.]
MKNNSKVFWIFFVIALVMSINSASAALIKENNNTKTYHNGMEDINCAVNVLDKDMEELHKYIDPICEMVDIRKFLSGRNLWNFWKWPLMVLYFSSKAKDIGDYLKQNKNAIKECNNKISADLKNLKAVRVNIGITGEPEPIDPKLQKAQFMAEDLGEGYTAEVVSAADIQEGDVVQYISGKYDRYLKVEEIIDNKREGKNIKSEPSTNQGFLLSGPHEKIVFTPRYHIILYYVIIIAYPELLQFKML